MHHKRGRARRRRAGCKLCKPWKVNGVRNERKDGERFSDHRRRVDAQIGMMSRQPLGGAASDSIRSARIEGLQRKTPGR